MMIRVGLLFIPLEDAEALQAVHQLLRERLTSVLLFVEQSAPSQQRLIEELLRRWCDEDELDLLITIGGTRPAPGPSAHEIVPEATLAVCERLLPGLAEEMRALASTDDPLALLERCVTGIRGRSLILNLPMGARTAVRFLNAVVDLIEPVMVHLQEQPQAPPSLQVAARDAAKFDAIEFEAFLRRNPH